MLTIKEFAKKKGVTPTAIQVAIKEGRIQAATVEVRYKYLIPEEELKNYKPRNY